MIGHRRPRPAGRQGYFGRGWVAGAVAIVALGTLGTIVAARAVGRSDGQRSQRAFATSSANVVTQVTQAILREEDLVVSTTAFVVANPTISNRSFNRWVQSDTAFARYPELVGLVRIVIVPANQLSAFAARTSSDPAGALAADGSLHVVPAGRRAFYCLADLAGVSPAPGPVQLAGSDRCAGVDGARLLAARDSGQSTYQPVHVRRSTALSVQVPLYHGGVIPTTIAARRAAFIGWIDVALLPNVPIATALSGHPGMAVTLRFVAARPPIAFSGGEAPAGAHTVMNDLRNGWTVQTSAAVTGAGIFENRNAAAVLIGGIALSVLLGLLGAVLATGRARALRLIGKQTVALQERADELHASVTELQTAQAVKDEFLALVTHELRTPLTSILGYSELLREEQLDEAQRTYVDVIDRNSSRLLSLVEDLLLMAQIQSGGLPLELGEVMLNDLIARSGEAAQPFAASKEIGLEVDVDPEHAIAMQGDAVRLGQVIDNLVSNAIKYTPKGGDVSITMRRTGPTATIAVSDTGMGIPAAEQSQLFSRFFRSSNARLAGVDGTGLGLAITRGIVEAHGGTIAFDSVEGSGTTFRVTLPLEDRSGLASAA